MRCPNCGLVHPETARYCRRCQVDLRTGQPRPRETATGAISSPPAGQQLLGWVRGVATRVQSIFSSRSSPAALSPALGPGPGKKAVPAGPGSGRMAGAVRNIRKSFTGLFSRLWPGRSGLRTLACIQCSGPMHIERVSGYGAGGPIALMLAGIVVFVLGRWAWPLYALGPVGVALGIFYRSRGASFWHCRSCGYRIARGG